MDKILKPTVIDLINEIVNNSDEVSKIKGLDENHYSFSFREYNFEILNCDDDFGLKMYLKKNPITFQSYHTDLTVNKSLFKKLFYKINSLYLK